MSKTDGWDKLESAITAGKNEMTRMDAWDALENAVGDALAMARLAQLAKDRAEDYGDDDDLASFAISDTIKRIEAIADAYNRLHIEINKPDPMPERLAG